MDLSSSNPKAMFAENAEGASGGTTATLEVPSLKEIAKDSPENCDARIRTFENYYVELMHQSPDNFFANNSELIDAATEAKNATEEVAKSGNKELTEQLLKTQERLSGEWNKQVLSTPPSGADQGILDPFKLDSMTLQSIGLEVTDSKIDESAKKEIISALQKEAGEKGVEPLNLSNDQINELGKQLAQNPEFLNRVKEGNVKIEVIRTPEDAKEVQKESFLWRSTKKVGELLFWGAVGAGVLVVGYGLLQAYMPSAAKPILELASKGLDVIIKGFHEIGNFCTNIWNSIWGIGKNLAQTQENLSEAGKAAGRLLEQGTKLPTPTDLTPYQNLPGFDPKNFLPGQ
jgi:hypothetical protein